MRPSENVQNIENNENLQNITFSFKLSKSPLKMGQLCTFLNKLFVVRITIDLVFNDFFVTHDLGPVKPGPRAAKPIIPRTSKIIIGSK